MTANASERRGIVRTLTVGTAGFLRSIWSVLGMTLLLLLLIECGFRIKQQLSGELVSNPPIPPSYRNADWYAPFTAEYDATRQQRWKPYVYFGRWPSFQGRYVNIDEFGRRVTPQPTSPAEPAATVFFFGGSTMWGTAQRDSQTIAAEASRRLQREAGEGRRIAVTNFGESGYVTTQGVLELMLQLRAGNRPDVVVFFDGINDVFATVQAGAPGVPQNEAKRVGEFTMGRQLDRFSYARGVRKDLKSAGLLVVTLVKQFALVDWVLQLAPPTPPALISVDSATRSTVRVYAENMKMVEGLAGKYGFTAVYVWQPSIHSTQKPLTAFEQSIRRWIESDSTQNLMRAVHLAAPPLLDAAMSEVAPGRFVNASALFQNDSSDVYFDRIGHNTEASVPVIVDAFWPALKAAVSARKAPDGARSVPFR